MPRKQPLGKIKPKKSKPPAQDPIEQVVNDLVKLVVEEHEPPLCSLSLPEPASEPASTMPSSSQVKTRSRKPSPADLIWAQLSRFIQHSESKRNLKLRKLKERQDRQDARDNTGRNQDGALRALNLHEIALERARANLICAEMKIQLLEKGLDEYRKECRMWEGLYRDTLDSIGIQPSF
jgi:hypothetical protein